MHSHSRQRHGTSSPRQSDASFRRKACGYLWASIAGAILYLSLTPTQFYGTGPVSKHATDSYFHAAKGTDSQVAHVDIGAALDADVKSESLLSGVRSPASSPAFRSDLSRSTTSDRMPSKRRIVWNYTAEDLDLLSAAAHSNRMPLELSARCPPQTERHPAVAVADIAGAVSSKCTPLEKSAKLYTLDPARDVLEAWGLHPRADSPLPWPNPTDEDCTPHSAWRGAAVEVLANTSRPVLLPASYGRRKRTEADIQSRTDYHSVCINLAGPKGTAHEVSGGTMPVFTPPTGRAPTRKAVYSHGFSVHSRIQQWLSSVDEALHANSTHGASTFLNWQTTNQYSGPWVEDYWASTFARPRQMELILQDDALTLVWSTGEDDGVATDAVYSSLADLESHHREGIIQVLHPHTKEPLPRNAGIPHYASMSPDRTVSVLFPYDPELFFPWIPLFVPWNSIMWASTQDNRMKQHLCKLGEILSSTLAADAQFVTLVQRAAGPWLGTELGCGHTYLTALQNTVVLTAGGVGHVPIPLLAQVRPFLDCSAQPSIQGHTHDVIFVGNERKGARDEALQAVKHSGRSTYSGGHEQLLQELVDSKAARGLRTSWSLPQAHLPPIGTAVQDVSADHPVHLAWMRAMAGGTFQLAPRGTGPTSFRLYESLQMGLVPIYIHDGQPWLPYLRRGQKARWQADLPEAQQSLWSQIALVMDTQELRQWLAPLDRMDLDKLQDDTASLSRSFFASRISDVSEQTPGTTVRYRGFKRMQLAAARARDRYFTYDGMFRRIAEWLDDPLTAELDCQGSSFLDPNSEM